MKKSTKKTYSLRLNQECVNIIKSKNLDVNKMIRDFIEKIANDLICPTCGKKLD